MKMKRCVVIIMLYRIAGRKNGWRVGVVLVDVCTMGDSGGSAIRASVPNIAADWWIASGAGRCESRCVTL